MVRRWGLLMLAAILTLSAVSFAQPDKPKPAPDLSSFYKLDLTVREMDGSKTLNIRTYAISQGLDDWGQLRVGSRLPVVTGAFTTEGKEHTQWQYIDIGLNMDSRLREKDGVVSLDWRLELSSVATERNESNQPIVRTVKNNGQTVLPMGKPTVMASVDDLSSTHKFLFEITATKVK
jgi:hypothetical protein